MLNENNTRRALKIIVVEDDVKDFDLIKTALSEQLPCDIHLAMSKGDFEKELTGGADVIVSDSNVASFDGFAALKLAGEMSPHAAFVFCSGTVPDEPRTDIRGRPVLSLPKDDGFAGLVAFIKSVLASKTDEDKF